VLKIGTILTIPYLLYYVFVALTNHQTNRDRSLRRRRSVSSSHVSDDVWSKWYERERETRDDVVTASMALSPAFPPL